MWLSKFLVNSRIFAYFISYKMAIYSFWLQNWYSYLQIIHYYYKFFITTDQLGLYKLLRTIINSKYLYSK